MIGSDNGQSAAPPGEDTFRVRAPQINLPKGGGAIRGIGEKFAANPVTGTGSMTVPIAVSPGRSGFGPQLGLSYDSGAGNGPFGFGWNLSTPSITRKTDKGLPSYRDAEDSDVFILSGAEDLVPTLIQRPDGSWIRESVPRRTVGTKTYDIRRYRPRIEGLFARIERWSNVERPDDVHWRSISRDNLLTLYGLDDESRIRDPLDPARIFSWLVSETRDDRGNGVLYRYKPENGEGVDLASLPERNRGVRADPRRAANRYLKRIHYGNRNTLLDTAGRRPPFLDQGEIQRQLRDAEWMFEVVFDYGEHDADAPLPQDRPGWKNRPDAFSSYRAGFEIRTTRLCRRVLMFHHFPVAAGVGRNCLVRSTDFRYSSETNPADPRDPVYSFLQAVEQTGYRRDDGGYARRSLPPVEFEYTKPVIQDVIEEVDPQSVENLPAGSGGGYRWVDLHGEGITGIVTEQGGTWYYKRNLSPVPDLMPDGSEALRAKFAPLETVAAKPNLSFESGAEVMDLAGDGQPDIVTMQGPTPGFYEHDEGEGWQSFRAFTSRLNRDWRDSNLKFIDLDGDGHADVLITENEAFVWHASLGEAGFGPARRVAKELDEEDGPRIVFADGTQSIHLADLSGDGLTDIVRIRNGEVCYWPNLGHGRFGAKITMTDAPWFDHPDQFEQARIRLADIDGSGTTDILYLHRDGVRVYFNQSGNGWSQATPLRVYPRIDEIASIEPVDLLGNGTSCLVWSSPLGGDARRPMRYVNLMGPDKPHLLVRMKNNLGATTEVKYAPSTKFYLLDKHAGRPWITRLPFPVHVVEQVSVSDKWRHTTFSTRYSYHHGYFDGVEREFRGFGRVESIDTEDYDKFSAGNIDSPYITSDHRLFQPPIKTISWFHTGVFADRARVMSQYENEFFPNSISRFVPAADDFRENALPEPDFADIDLSPEEWREALRACKGIALRQEIYELDVEGLRKGVHEPVKLFSTAHHNCHIDRLQPRRDNRHAVFLVGESEAITYHYELDLRTPGIKPDPRVAHTLNLRTDEFGNILQSVAVGYPRFGRFETANAALVPQTRDLIRAVQEELHVAYSETRFTNRDIDEPDTYRLRMPCEVQTYELTGIRTRDAKDALSPDVRDERYFSIEELRAYRLSTRYQADGLAVAPLEYHEQPDRISNPPPAQRRLVELARTIYYDDAGASAPTQRLPFGEHGPRGFKYEDYKLALTEELLSAVFGAKLDESIAGSNAREKLALPNTSGYLSGAELAARFAPSATAGEYWMRSGVVGLSAAARFFLPERHVDSFSVATEVLYDNTHLYFIESTTDARLNESRVVDFDFRVLAPRAMSDPNKSVTRVAFDLLGMPVAIALETAGDSLTGLTAALLDPPATELERFFGIDAPNPPSPYDASVAVNWLDDATTRFLYHFGDIVRGGVRTYEAGPPAACGIQREKHVPAAGAGPTKIQVSLEYSDGGGNVLVKKSQAEPAPGTVKLRWIASGKTVFNNKGKPVKQYEPYFSRTEHRFDAREAADEIGVTPVMYYDAQGRLVRTEMADGTFSKVEFSPWYVMTYDANDTAFGSTLGNSSDWYRRRKDPAHPRFAEFNDAQNARAAELVEQHADTPAQAHLDSLGREVVSIAHNRTPDPAGVWQHEFHVTHTRLDAEGKPLWIRDARGNLVMQYLSPYKANDEVNNDVPFRMDPLTGRNIYSAPAYDVAGNLLFQHSMDAGNRWLLADAAGKPMLSWEENDSGPGTALQSRQFLVEYDDLRRPARQSLKTEVGAVALIEAFEYCDTSQPNGAIDVADARQRRLIGQVVKYWDPSGLSSIERVDLCGKPSHVKRTLIRTNVASGGMLDWQADRVAPLEAETFHKLTEFDALGRSTLSYNWHREAPDNRVAVFEFTYNERGSLLSQTMEVGARKVPDGHLPAPAPARKVIEEIRYDAKGQQELLRLGNKTTTRYTYDPETFRLLHLFTTRAGPISRGDCTSNSANAARPRRPCGMQNLHYTYDAVGSVTHVRDDAQDSRFFRGAYVEASNEYTYDALHRLIEATGRENAAAVAPPKNREDPWPNSSFPSADALRNYVQRYEYDQVGNFVSMIHAPSGGTGWTRHYETRADSNRLDKTWYNADIARAVTYHHDARGNVLNINRTEPPRLAGEEWGLELNWDWRDTLLDFDIGTGQLARYFYGIDKQRTRKYIRRGINSEDRIYLDGYELYRRRNGSGDIVEEIETQHVFAGAQRVLMVEDVVRSSKGTPDPRPDGLSVNRQTLFRYQYGNHLGSVSLELDELGEIISYEEFQPYGTCAYRLMNAGKEAPPRRYRYIGMERDEESGFQYNNARYFMPSIARWLSCDPQTDQHRYAYSNASPQTFSDVDGNAPSNKTRFWGTLQAIGGMAQMITGAAFAINVEAPPLAVGGALLAVHGFDDLNSGIKKIITGESEENATVQAATAVAQGFGVDKDKSIAFAKSLDLVLGLISPTGPLTGGSKLATSLASGGNIVESVATKTGPSIIPPIVAMSSAAKGGDAVTGNAPEPPPQLTTPQVAGMAWGRFFSLNKPAERVALPAFTNLLERLSGTFLRENAKNATILDQLTLFTKDAKGGFIDTGRRIDFGIRFQKADWLLEVTTRNQLSLALEKSAAGLRKLDQLEDFGSLVRSANQGGSSLFGRARGSTEFLQLRRPSLLIGEYPIFEAISAGLYDLEKLFLEVNQLAGSKPNVVK
jgi:RHS repeat-associated protein